MDKYRTVKDIMRDLAKVYTLLGDLLDELDRMINIQWKAKKTSLA